MMCVLFLKRAGMKRKGCSLQAAENKNKNCVNCSCSHKGFFHVSVMNHVPINTFWSCLTFNKFIQVFTCFFGTMGVKSYLLM